MKIYLKTINKKDITEARFILAALGNTNPSDEEITVMANDIKASDFLDYKNQLAELIDEDKESVVLFKNYKYTSLKKSDLNDLGYKNTEISVFGNRLLVSLS